MAIAFASVALAAPRPELDLAAVAPPTPNGKPWPLAELPSLQPHLDLAMASDACSAAATKRARDDEVRAYLAAWCRIRAGYRDAVDALAPLARGSDQDVARAARLDIVDLLADYTIAKDALARLKRLQLGTPDLLDLLAATYRALGLRDDAFVVGFEAARVDPHPTLDTTCERVLAWSTLDERDLVDTLELIGAGGRTTSCARRARAIHCALSRASSTGFGFGSRLVLMRECFVELPDDPDRDAKLNALVVYASWTDHDVDGWLAVAREAETALSVRGAEALAVTALENALHGSSCGKHAVSSIAATARELATADLHDSSFDARLAPLRELTPERCKTGAAR